MLRPMRSRLRLLKLVIQQACYFNYFNYCIHRAPALSSFNLTRENTNYFLSRLTKSSKKPLFGMLRETMAVMETRPWWLKLNENSTEICRVA